MPDSATCTSAEREEVSLALTRLRQTVTENPFVPVEPTEPQAVFLAVPVKEVLYGGAAGGGKSCALLAAALQYVTQPGYAALLLRRTFADLVLPDALIPLSHQWLHGKPGAQWDGQRHQWRFPGGSSLTFGYLDTEVDKYRYQGASLNFCGFDELTQFSESQYRYLFSRLRRKEGVDVPLRMRAASNPGGIGHEWVRRRFIDATDPDRLFVPAALEDNPYLDRAAYEESLANLDPVTRAQLRHGDWEVAPEGNLFKREWFVGQNPACPTVNPAAVPPMIRQVRAWDLAATEESEAADPDYTAGCLMGVDAQGVFWVRDVQEFRATPADVERRVIDAAQRDGRGVEVHVEQEPGASGKTIIDHYRRTVLPGFAVYGVRATGDKITRARPFSAACQNGLVRLVRGSWIGRFIDRIVSFGLPGMHDDVTDAASCAHRGVTRGGKPWGQQAVRDAFDGPGRSLDEPAPREPANVVERLLQASRGGGGRWGDDEGREL